MNRRAFGACASSGLLLYFFCFANSFVLSTRPRELDRANYLGVPSFSPPPERAEFQAIQPQSAASFIERRRIFPPPTSISEEGDFPENPVGPSVQRAGADDETRSPPEEEQLQAPPRGRLERLRRFVGNMGRRARSRLRRIWTGIKRGAAKVKMGARRAARAVYRKLPRIRRQSKQQPSYRERLLSGEGEEGEASTSASSSEEEFLPALTPEEYSAKYGSGVGKAEERAAAAEPEAVSEVVPNDCLEFLMGVNRYVLNASRRVPELCALWSRFSGTCNISKLRDTDILAGNLAEVLVGAKKLSRRDTSFSAVKLRLALALARAEDRVARAGRETDKACWLARVQQVMKRMTREERELFETILESPMSVARDPLSALAQMGHLMNLVEKDGDSCVEKAKAEVLERERLQDVLMAQRDKLEATLRTRKLTPGEEQEAEELMRDLLLLRNREFCSNEIISIVAQHAKNIKAFIIDFKASENGRRWWKIQIPMKISSIMPIARGSKSVPSHIAKGCRAYEKSKLPRRITEVATFLEWFWEVALQRGDDYQQ
ncbi:hypothetical protein, conserved [Eimeria tenella]|uniref:Uncharacterized protein n=1 Tax=Eimeria tenella TaxID=5802 RepID=U6KWA1_EIMTE|nr:hypothetical protein, conserved [Eimeria tenella]CDJ42246.1 hypothetical protein, conserved [Eimeria tenella]|eukprot:XP_013232996.1 hypothetical protein, conserved [Eimeria tenella]